MAIPCHVKSKLHKSLTAVKEEKRKTKFILPLLAIHLHNYRQIPRIVLVDQLWTKNACCCCFKLHKALVEIQLNSRMRRSWIGHACLGILPCSLMCNFAKNSPTSRPHKRCNCSVVMVLHYSYRIHSGKDNNCAGKEVCLQSFWIEQTRMSWSLNPTISVRLNTVPKGRFNHGGASVLDEGLRALHSRRELV